MAEVSSLSPAKRALLERTLRAGADRPAAPASIPRRPDGGPAPLSIGQEQVWFFSQLSPELGVYNEGATIRKRGPIDLDALRRAFDEVVRRHEIWRTCFPAVGGVPVQHVLPAPSFPLPVTDLSGLPGEEREAEAIRLATEDARAPYDLSRGPLVRPRLVRLAEDDHRLYLALHHIIFDGVSLYGVLMPELVALYDAYAAGLPSPLPEPALQYADYAAWQREQAGDAESERRLAYWRRQLAGELPGAQLPFDHERPAVQRFRGAVKHVEVPRELVGELRGLAHREGTSLFMVLAAAFTVLLRRYSGQEDVVFGTPADGRSRPELQKMMGFCLNAAVLRIPAAADSSFLQLLSTTKGVTLDALSNEVPFERLVRELHPERDLSRNPLFQVMFGIEPPSPSVDGAWSIHQMDVGVGTAKFDLYVEQDERPEGHISCRFVYNADLFEAGTVGRMGEHWLRLLEGVAADPGCRLWELPMLGEAERERLLVERNRTFQPLPEGSVLELIKAQVERRPDAVAVEFEGLELSYRELAERSNRLAHHLRGMGVGRESTVGLCVERSPEMVVGVLGIWKAGGAYLPLDPRYPSQRLAYMVEDSGARVLLTQSGVLEKLELGAERVVLMDREEGWAGQPAAAPEGGPGPAELAYVIYTSGSTGRPKGVQIPHRSLVNFLCSMATEPGLGETGVLVAVTTLSFDIAALELYLPLVSGARLVLASAEVVSDGERLGELLARSGATFLQATPAGWRLLLESGWKGQRGLTGLCGGEALAPELAARILDRCQRLYNVYGPTETTIWSTLAKVEKGRPLTIGRPLANTQVYVLDSHLDLVPEGVAGELYIGGAGLARGYRGRPELTAERFVANPFAEEERLYRTGDLVRWLDGELEYLGRLDQQLKVRGFRIEPGEVEAALLQEPGVSHAVVLAREDRPGDRRLVAYLVGAPDEADPGRLKAGLRKRLPEYMVPSAYVFLDRFPQTPNGKLDRKALPAPEPADAKRDLQPPQTEIEQALAELWSEVLGLERVDREADFFELGGHSLLATLLAARLRQALGVELPLRAFFEATTLAAMAAVIEEQQRGSSGEAAALQVIGELSLSQQRAWFLQQLEPDDRSNQFSVGLRLEGDLDEQALLRALEEVVSRHEVLRTGFEVENGELVQVLHPAGRPQLTRHDLSGLSRLQRERALGRLTAEEAARGFDLASPPLLRTALLELSSQERVLLLTLHRIVADERSLVVLLGELEALYGAFSSGERTPLEPPAQFSAHARREREELGTDEMATRRRYWRRRLAGMSSLDLPTDHPRGAPTAARAASLRLRLPKTLSRPAAALGAGAGGDLGLALLTAWLTLLARHGGQDDIAIAAAAGQPSQSDRFSSIGPFDDVEALRVSLGGDPGFTELMTRVNAAREEAIANRGPSLREALVGSVPPPRPSNRNPLLRAFFSYQGLLTSPRLPGLRTSVFEVDSASCRADLSLLAADRDGQLECRFEYDAALYERATILRLGAQLRRLLEAALVDPARPVAELPLLDARERSELASEWKVSARTYPRGACVPDLFEAQVRAQPDAMAVTVDDQRLSYRELDGRANQLAQRLRGLGLGAEALCAICLPRSLDLVVAILGVLKAGAAYVPLDPELPAERLQAMMRDADTAVLLTQQRLMAGMAARMPTLDVTTVLLDSGWSVIASQPSTAPARRGGSRTLACVVYGPGSAAEPQGVMVEHRAVVNHLTALRRDHRIGAGDTVLQLASLSSLASLRDLLGPLCAGAGLVLLPGAVSPDPRAVLGAVQAHRVTCLLSLPPALGRVLSKEPGPAAMRLVSTWGESPRMAGARRLAERFGCEVVHEWAPAGGGLAATRHSLGPAAEISSGVLAGRAEANVRLYILDGNRAPQPVGVPGELYVGGESLARGYLRRPQLTTERFLPDPFNSQPGARMYRTGQLARRLADGSLEWLGGPERRARVRGFLVDLAEVEAALGRHPLLGEVAAAVRGQRLVAYGVPNLRPGPEAAELRAFLRERLPEFMVPSAYIEMEALPRNPGGELDPGSLPEPASDRPRRPLSLLPRTPGEEAVAQIWCEALRVPEVGVRDDFFEAGGTSLLAVKVAADLERIFGQSVPLASFFMEGEATVEALAAQVEHRLERGGSGLVIEASSAGSLPPLFFVFSDESALLSLRHFLPALGTDRPVYGLVPERQGRRFDRTGSIEKLSAGLLRAIRQYQATGPYCICGHSLGGLLAYELGRQLSEAGETVAFLGIMDALTPQATNRWLKASMSPRARLGRQVRRGFRGGIAKLYDVADRQARGVRTRMSGPRGPMAADEFDIDGALAIGRRYRPHGYRGQVSVFGTDASAAASGGRDLGWAEVHRGGLDCVEVPGDHLTMLNQPNVGRAAAALARRLRQLAETHGNGDDEGERQAS